MRAFTLVLPLLSLSAGVLIAPAQAAPPERSVPGGRRMTSPVNGPGALGTTIPQTCRADITMVYPSTTLVYAEVVGTTPARRSAGVKLGFLPRAISYARTINGGNTDVFHAVDSSGQMWRLTSTWTGTRNVLTKKRLGSGWGWVRTMTTGYPFIYAVSSSGQLKRISIWNSGGIGSVVTLPGGTAHKTVNSLSYGGYWEPGSGGLNERQDDIVFTDTAGRLGAYSIPRKTYSKTGRWVLRPSGWHLKHLTAGYCSSGDSRSLIGISTTGDVGVYLDRNGADQSGADIAFHGKVANWAGVFGD